MGEGKIRAQSDTVAGQPQNMSQFSRNIKGIETSENGSFPLLYVLKMSLRREWVVQKRPKLHYIRT